MSLLGIVLRICKTLLVNIWLTVQWYVLRRRAESPYLEGNFGPVQHELDTGPLPVLGHLPDDLRGLFVRTGPNPKYHPLGEYHWFDGDGMFHSVQLGRTGAYYHNRFFRSHKLRHEMQLGHAHYFGLGAITKNFMVVLIETVRAKLGFRARLPRYPRDSGGNTALEFFRGRLLALFEVSIPWQIRAPTLDTIGPYDFDGQVNHSFTAHPKVDPETGEMMFFGYQLQHKPYLRYKVVDKEGRITTSLEIDIPKPVMIHDFAITEQYTVFFILPLVFDPRRMLLGQPGLAFDASEPSRYCVLPRHAASAAEAVWFEGPACFMFHTANAWQEGDEVVVYGMRNPRSTILFPSTTGNAADLSDPHLHEWRFNLRQRRLTEREWHRELIAEFPRVHPSRLGRPSRFVYAGVIERGRPHMPTITGVVKFDLAAGTAQTLRWPDNGGGGECVFVPRAGGSDEDDGYLLTFVYQPQRHASDLVVVDARAMRERARVQLPVRVPYGFHGRWLTESELISEAV